MPVGQVTCAAEGEFASGRSQESWFQLKQNTSVYVTGLPPDATEMEVAQHFSKCGVIKLDEEQRPRVKIYRCASAGVRRARRSVSWPGHVDGGRCRPARMAVRSPVV